MALITGIDHPAIASKDIAALCGWYQKTLGYSFAAKVENGAWLLEAPDGTFLEVMPADGSSDQGRTLFSAGLSHLALRVSNLDEAITALDACGVTWTNDISPAVGGGRLRNFPDPEGNILQIVER